MGERVTSDMLRSLNHRKTFQTEKPNNPKTLKENFPSPLNSVWLLFTSAAFDEVLGRLFGLPLARTISSRGSQRKQSPAGVARG